MRSDLLKNHSLPTLCAGKEPERIQRLMVESATPKIKAVVCKLITAGSLSQFDIKVVLPIKITPQRLKFTCSNDRMVAEQAMPVLKRRVSAVM